MITLTLNNQNLSISTPHIVGNTIDYLTVQIQRSAEWQGMTLHVFFKKENTVYEIITDESFIDKNSHLNLSNGQWSVSIVGYRFVNDILVEKITTNSIGLKVATPPPKAGESMPSVPPSAFEQVEAMAKSVRDEARTGKFDGATFTPAVSDEGIISWTNNKGLPNPDPVDVKGAPGQDGEDGEDGYSPTISITDITGGHRVTITDKTGAHSFDVMDGEDGQDGTPGADGEDGVSPTVTVTGITGGHRVTITDATGPHSFDVMDGEDGEDGAGVPAGGTAGQILSKRSGTDFDTEWVDSPDFPASLVIVTPPTTVDYEIGDAFDSTGMVVQLVSSKGQIETVEHDALEFTPSVFSETGLQQVTVTWKEWPYTLYAYQAVSVVEIITDTWAKIAQVTAAGLAADYFDIADQIADTWGSYTAPWDVVHIDGTGMFLQWHYATPVDITFDAPEAIYYAPSGGLAAGTYHITIGQTQGTGWVQGSSIQFTLAQAADEGDQFVIVNAAEATDPTAGATINVYGAGSTTVKQSATTSNGTGGTLLGTTSQYVADGNVNATQFVVVGRNDWGQSAYRQYLNVRQPAGSWWTPQNGWDRPPAQAATQNSFAYSVSQELWDVLEPVDVVTATNNATNPPSNSYTTQDRFFLPSLQEMYINSQLAGVEGVDWDYYKELAQEAGLTGKFQQYGTYAILRKFRIGSTTSAALVWLRSCVRGHRYEWYVGSSGLVDYNNPLVASRCAPACKLKSLQS